MIKVTNRNDNQFPIGLQLNDGGVQKLTLKAAKELLNNLDVSIQSVGSVDEIYEKKRKYSGYHNMSARDQWTYDKRHGHLDD